MNIPEPGKSNNNDRTNVYMIHLSGRLACIRGSIQGPLKPFGPSQHYRIEGLKGGPQVGSHYDKRCQYVSSEGELYCVVATHGIQSSDCCLKNTSSNKVCIFEKLY